MATLRSSETPGSTSVAITAQTSAFDPDSCKFTCDRVLHEGDPVSFQRHQPGNALHGSPLADDLLTLDGVASVVIAGSTVTVGRATVGGQRADWAVLRGQVADVIRTRLAASEPIVVPVAQQASPADAAIRAALENLLDRDINPAIAAHGGQIAIVDVRNAVVSIAMSGGCQGCASSTATLRQGFETKARLVAPGIERIDDVTDHSAGVAPFYRPESAPGDRSSPLANPVRRPSATWRR